MAKKIFLSPSNQDDNKYAYGNTTEDVQCGRIARACKIALERCGFEVRLEQYDTMANRVKHSNAWGADMHVPIHTNAFNKKVTGTRLFCYSKTGPGYKACQAVFKYLAPLTPGKSENISVNKNLYEVAATDMCSVYVEAEFHDNKEAAKWIIENVEAIGEAIAHGIADYFGYKWVEPIKEPVVEEAPKKEVKELYRVRKSWTDAKSQLGAFEYLENAQRMANKYSGYGVYDWTGREVYRPEDKIKEGDEVKLIKGALVYDEDYTFDDWVYNATLYVREVEGNRVVVSTQRTGAVTGAVHLKYLRKV